MVWSMVNNPAHTLLITPGNLLRSGFVTDGVAVSELVRMWLASGSAWVGWPWPMGGGGLELEGPTTRYEVHTFNLPWSQPSTLLQRQAPHLGAPRPLLGRAQLDEPPISAHSVFDVSRSPPSKSLQSKTRVYVRDGPVVGSELDP